MSRAERWRWVVAGTVTQLAKLNMSRQQNMDKQIDRPPHFYRPKSRTQEFKDHGSLLTRVMPKSGVVPGENAEQDDSDESS